VLFIAIPLSDFKSSPIISPSSSKRGIKGVIEEKKQGLYKLYEPRHAPQYCGAMWRGEAGFMNSSTTTQ